MNRALRSLSLTLMLVHVAVASWGCSGGCKPMEFHPIDRDRNCLFPAVQSGCDDSAPGGGNTCSVEPGGSMYLSRNGRLYPDARRCTQEEEAEVDFTKLALCD